MWGIFSLAEELLASLETRLHGISWFCIYLWVPLNFHVVYCMELGIVQDLGCYGGNTKYSVRILVLHCVTGQIVPMFQKIILPLKHHELCAQ